MHIGHAMTGPLAVGPGAAAMLSPLVFGAHQHAGHNLTGLAAHFATHFGLGELSLSLQTRLSRVFSRT